jgi:hypothetical protein
MSTWPTSKAAARRLSCATLTAAVWLAASLVCTAVSAGAQCTGPGAPTTTQTKCLTAITIPGNPLRSFDISWVNPDRAEYYLADQSNKGVDIIDTRHNTFKKTIVGDPLGLHFVGPTGNRNTSGPDGVVSHGKWLYAGDGDSTLKVIDLDTGEIVASLSTGGTTRVDEMALTTDGKLLLVANNAEDPPFGTLFTANGDDESNSVTKLTRIDVDPSIIPSGHGLSIEQPAWDPKTERFYTSIPTIAENPAGCNYGQLTGPVTCSGGLLVTNPEAPNAIEGAYDPATNTGVIPLNSCGPNGATIGPHDNVMVGCTPANLPSGTTTLVINATTHNYAQVAGVTGSDEVWFNKGDDRYYTGSSAMPGGAVLGVIDGTSVLIETIPQSSRSHSVAADSKRNHIFVPQAAPAAPGKVGDTTNVGAGICGGTNGCIAVYGPRSKDKDEEEADGSDAQK